MRQPAKRRRNYSIPCLLQALEARRLLTTMGYLDTAGSSGLALNGWALDTADTSTASDLRIKVDGVIWAYAATNLYRPDLTWALPFPVAAGPLHGFIINLYDEGRVSLQGSHRVQVEAADRNHTSWTPLVGTQNILGPMGYLDGVAVNAPRVIHGWAFDPLSPSTPAQVTVRIDGVAVRTQSVNLDRPDVTAYLAGRGYSCGVATGYAISLEDMPQLATGRHKVTVEAASAGSPALVQLLNQQYFEPLLPPARVLQITSPEASKSLAAGATLHLNVVFDQALTLSGTPVLHLSTGRGTVDATYSGKSATSLNFVYQIQAGDDLASLKSADSTLSWTGTLLNDSMLSPSPLLPAPGTAGSIESLNIHVDTSPPAAPIPSQTKFCTNQTSLSLTGTREANSKMSLWDDLNNNQIPESNEVTALYQYSGDPASFMVTATVHGAASTWRLKAIDAAGNESPYSVPIDVRQDLIRPTIYDIKAKKANNFEGQKFQFDVTFSEPVFLADASSSLPFSMDCSNNPQPYPRRASARYISGSGTAHLTFQYLLSNSSETGDDLKVTPGNLAGLNLSDGVGNPIDPGGTTWNLPVGYFFGAHYATPFLMDIEGGTAPRAQRSVLLRLGEESASECWTRDMQVYWDKNANGKLDADETELFGSCPIDNGSSAYVFGLLHRNTTNYLLAQVRDYQGNVSDAMALPPLVEDDLGPAVVSIRPEGTQKLYHAGESLMLDVNFSEPVKWMAYPTLALDLDNRRAICSYVGSSDQGQTLKYRLDVQAGDSTSLLEVSRTEPFIGGMGEDALGQNLTLTLPAPGTAGSLGAAHLAIDAVGPVAQSIRSLSTDGTYGVGASLGILVKFDEPVVLHGTLELPLVLDTRTVLVACSGGDGTDTLRFDYQVASGDSTARGPWLEVPDWGSLVLDGSLTDPWNNPADLHLPRPGDPGALSTHQHLAIQAAPPRPPVVSHVSPDSGQNDRDGITTAAQLSFGGSAMAGLEISLQLDGQDLPGTVLSGPDGCWSFDASALTLTSGHHRLQARARDAMGNLSDTSEVYHFFIDSSPLILPAQMDVLAMGADNLLSWETVASPPLYSDPLMGDGTESGIVYQIYRNDQPLAVTRQNYYLDNEPPAGAVYRLETLTWGGSSSGISAVIQPNTGYIPADPTLTDQVGEISVDFGQLASRPESAVVDWDDGSPLESVGNSLEITHNYRQSGSYVPRLMEHNKTFAAARVGISAQAPLADGLQGPTVLAAESTGEFRLINPRDPSHPDHPDLQYEFDMGNGWEPSGAVYSWHASTPGSYPIQARVYNSAGKSPIYTLNVEVTHGLPILQVYAPDSIVMGQEFTLGLDASEPVKISASPLTYQVDWGDGGPLSSGTVGTPPMHTYSEWSASRSIHVVVSNAAGGQSVKDLEVTLVPPPVIVDIPDCISVGMPLNIELSSGNSQSLSWEVNWGDQLPNDKLVGSQLSLKHSFSANTATSNLQISIRDLTGHLITTRQKWVNIQRGTITNFAASAEGSQAVRLSWTDTVSTPLGYIIEAADESGSFREIARTLPNARFANHLGVDLTQSHQYRIRYDDPQVTQPTSRDWLTARVAATTRGTLSWSISSADGRFGNNKTVDITISGLEPGVATTIPFHVQINDSWDGLDTRNGNGPDQLCINGPDGALLFDQSFTNNPGVFQSYPDGGKNPPMTGAVSTAGQGMAIYKIPLSFTPTQERATFHFTAHLKDSVPTLANESWSFAGLGNQGPNITVSNSSPSMPEGAGSSDVIFSRQGDTSQPITVRYALSGVADPACDYQIDGRNTSWNTVQEVVIPAGETYVALNLIPTLDDRAEPDETLRITVLADPAYMINSGDHVDLTIVDQSLNLTLDSNRDGQVNTADEAEEDRSPALVSLQDVDRDQDHRDDRGDFDVGAKALAFSTMTLSFPDGTENHRFSLNYDADEPRSSPADDAPYVPQGTLRIWTKPAGDSRNPLSVLAGGDFVPPSVLLTRSNLGSSASSVTLYIEAVAESPSTRISVMTGDYHNVQRLTDSVSLTVVKSNLGVNNNNGPASDPGDLLADGIPDSLGRIDADDDRLEELDDRFHFWWNDKVLSPDMGLVNILPIQLDIPASLSGIPGTVTLELQDIVGNLENLTITPMSASDGNYLAYLQDTQAGQALLNSTWSVLTSRDRYRVPAGTGKQIYAVRASGTKAARCSMVMMLTTDHGQRVELDRIKLSFNPVQDFWANWSTRGTPAASSYVYPLDGNNTSNINLYPAASYVASPAASGEHLPGVLDSSNATRDAKRQILIYIHGYNVSGPDIFNDGSEIFKRTWWQGYRGSVVTFSWDGDEFNVGSLLNTQRSLFDPNVFNAFQTAPRLVEFLENQILNWTDNTPGNINVMAHSMGNLVTFEALRLAERSSVPGRQGKLFNNLISCEGAVWKEAFEPEDSLVYPSGQYLTKSFLDWTWYSNAELRRTSWRSWYRQDGHDLKRLLSGQILESYDTADFALVGAMRSNDYIFHGQLGGSYLRASLLPGDRTISSNLMERRSLEYIPALMKTRQAFYCIDLGFDLKGFKFDGVPEYNLPLGATDYNDDIRNDGWMYPVNASKFGWPTTSHGCAVYYGDTDRNGKNIDCSLPNLWEWYEEIFGHLAGAGKFNFVHKKK